MKLLIISDTPIHKIKGRYLTFEPTLREVEYLSILFDEIVWYGMEVRGESPSSLFRLPNTGRISIKALPKARGGDKIWKKLAILPGLPILCFIIGIQFLKFNYIHTRGPSLPALIGILYTKVFRGKRVWHKYAGNWNQDNPPFSYKIQRSLLRTSKNIVTVNGFWNETNTRILSFENPCFSNKELVIAKEDAGHNFSGKRFNFLFVGRLEIEKGAHLVVEAAKNSSAKHNWFIVGEGKDNEALKLSTEGLNNIEFLGALNRDQLNLMYHKAHFLILPTIASEGFPKVISEASGHGCIPIVSKVSSIAQYVKPEFGFLLPEVSLRSIMEIMDIIDRNDDGLALMSQKAVAFAELFTYERFVQRIRTEVFFLA